MATSLFGNSPQEVMSEIEQERHNEAVNFANMRPGRVAVATSEYFGRKAGQSTARYFGLESTDPRIRDAELMSEIKESLMGKVASGELEPETSEFYDAFINAAASRGLTDATLRASKMKSDMLAKQAAAQLEQSKHDLERAKAANTKRNQEESIRMEEERLKQQQREHQYEKEVEEQTNIEEEQQFRLDQKEHDLNQRRFEHEQQTAIIDRLKDREAHYTREIANAETRRKNRISEYIKILKLGVPEAQSGILVEFIAAGKVMKQLDSAENKNAMDSIVGPAKTDEIINRLGDAAQERIKTINDDADEEIRQLQVSRLAASIQIQSQDPNMTSVKAFKEAQDLIKSFALSRGITENEARRVLLSVGYLKEINKTPGDDTTVIKSGPEADTNILSVEELQGS